MNSNDRSNDDSREENRQDGDDNSSQAETTHEPLVLEGRIVAPPVKITTSDARVIFRSFILSGSPKTLGEATAEDLAGVTSVSLAIKYSDDDSKQRIRAAALDLGIGVTGEVQIDPAGGKNQAASSVLYSVSFGQIKRLRLKLAEAVEETPASVAAKPKK